uniref:MULE transposase domain-containing protein n=1 Tax=Lactuca sativa TaxID=4236 RepID=A0A9R1VAI6_LACSA|nr:hypothetical protein LSAT_V11C600311600 [Lactuca sativa]
MHYLFEIQLKTNMSSCNVIRVVPIEIDCVLVIKERGTPDLCQKHVTFWHTQRQILSSLHQRKKNLPPDSRTIYNLKAKLRKDKLQNRSMVSALFEELEKEDSIYDILYNTIGHITHLFITHPLSIKLSKIFSTIFVMDCTYKTNKYHMPLLDIIGVSCFNTSFYSGFAFLEKEDEDSYIWALSAFQMILENCDPSVIMTDRELALMNAIKMVFPNTILNIRE